MRHLKVKIRVGDSEGLAIEYNGPGPFLLRDVLVSLKGWVGMLDALEREHTGKRRATLQWEIVEWALTEDVISEEAA